LVIGAAASAAIRDSSHHESRCLLRGAD